MRVKEKRNKRKMREKKRRKKRRKGRRNRWPAVGGWVEPVAGRGWVETP
jgi:hypothetical protein